jgi:hypothetical protein
MPGLADTLVHMAREKYQPDLLLDALANPNFWVHWVDANGELHHTPKSLLAIVPENATFVDEPQTR